VRETKRRSVRKKAKELDVSRASLGIIVRNVLKLYSYKKQKVQSMTEAQKAAKIQKCRQNLARHTSDDIIFSDEKPFLLQETHNPDRPDLFCFVDRYSKRKISCETISKCIQSHGQGVISKNGKLLLLCDCQNQPKLLHRACFQESSVDYL
jgi:hypothetical protein